MAAQPPSTEIISTDGHEFVADEKVLKQCDVLKRMLDETKPTTEAKEKVVRMTNDYCNINGKLLEKVIEYLYYKNKYTDSAEPIPEFAIDDEMVLDLLGAANYLGLNQ